MYRNVLEKAGLKTGEAELYDLLLQFGASSAASLVSKTKYKRGMVYKFLEDLTKKGLVSTFTKNKKTYFRPEHPHKIVDSIENTMQEAKMQMSSVQAVLPQLDEAYRMNEIRPTVQYYEGIYGIKRVFDDIYSPKTEPVYGCVDLEKSDKAVPSYVVEDLIPLRIKNKVMAISFVGNSKQAKEIHKKDGISLRKSVLLDKKQYPLPAEIDVYEDKVALLSFDKEKFAGILIQNKDIATSLKTIFKLAFEKFGKSETN